MSRRHTTSTTLCFLVSFLYQCACHPSDIRGLGISNIFPRDDLGPDPNDFTYITRFAAIGDSYAAGIGAGSPYDSNSTCARFDNAYSVQINAAEGLGDPSKRSFQFLACSGAKTGDVLDKQIPEMDDDQNLITLSVGGNDVGLSSILNACVFQFSANPLANCDVFLASAANYVENGLPGDLRRVIFAASKQLSLAPGSEGMLIVLGYAKFFDADTDQCDNQTWSFWYNDYINTFTKPYLTKARRKAMNDLVDGVNAAILEEVQAVGDQAIYVDYDTYVTQFRGCYCDNGTTEPEPNALGLLFYEWGTVDPGEFTWILQRSGTDVGQGTFGGDINGWVEQVHKAHPDWTYARPGGSKDSTKVLNDMQAASGDDVSRQLGTVSSLLPTSWLRVFHPRPPLHSIIANLVLYLMSQHRAQYYLKIQVGPEVASITQCDATPTPSIVAYNPNAPPPDVPSRGPPVQAFCQTYKDCPSCPQGQCPYCAATWTITVQSPGHCGCNACT